MVSIDGITQISIPHHWKFKGFTGNRVEMCNGI